MIKPRSLTSISLVFPCYNEADNVGQLIDQAVKVIEEYGVDYEVVIVDDGSRDNTAEIVRRAATKNPRVRLVSHEKNKGYGAAVATALHSAAKELVFFSDGDNQFHISDIEKLFSKIDSCDAVVGYRISRQDVAYRRLNGFVWTQTARMIFGLKVRDVDCAFKLFRQKFIKDLPLESHHLLIHAEILARLKKRGCRVQEIGVPHYPRTAGKATATRPEILVRSVFELLKLYWRIR